MPLFKSSKPRTESVKVLNKEEIKEEDASSQNSWSFSEDAEHSTPDAAEKSKLLSKGSVYYFLTLDAKLWNVAEVGQWLGIISLGQYRIPFIENAISGFSFLVSNFFREDLLELEEEDLINSLQIVKLGDRKKILRGIKALKSSKPFDIKSIETSSQGSFSASQASGKSHTTTGSTNSDSSSRASDDFDRFDLNSNFFFEN